MNKKTLFVVLPIILLVIQFGVLNYASGIIYSLFSYIDEFYVIILWGLCIKKNDGRIVLKKSDKTLIILSLVFVGIGLLCNFLTGYQSIIWAILDAFTCIKFTLYYLGIKLLIPKRQDSIYVINKLYRFSKKYILVLFGLSIANIFVDIFPKPDFRYFMYSIKLFYTHPTVLAMVSIICSCVIIVKNSYARNKNDAIYIGMGLVIACLTMRSKAIASVLCMLLIYLYFIKFRFKSKIALGVLSFVLAMFIGYDQISFHFGGYSAVNADFIRERLLIDSIKIANAYFPIGTGFGTFGSFVAAEHWSPLYDMYNYTYNYFLSDSFWPIILAQTGYVGVAIFACILFEYFKIILKLQKKNLFLLWAGLSIIIYELICSVGETAFFHPMAALPFILLGLIANIGNGKDIV